MPNCPIFNISKKSKNLSIFFSATLKNIDRAIDETKKFLHDLGFESHTFNIVLGLREALNNAVLKGCNQNNQKVVTYRLRYEDDRLIIEVEDEGDGFEWRRYWGKEPQTLAEFGRGLPIMEQYFEKIRFNEKGNKVILIKAI
jgi:serine/threonine-protein kinase RsbW